MFKTNYSLFHNEENFIIVKIENCKKWRKNCKGNQYLYSLHFVGWPRN